MFEFLKRLFGKEEISDKAILHSSRGDYAQNGRMKGGGHGQEAIDYMKRHGIRYHINRIYPNGVRVGYVPNHKKPKKQFGNNQSWFPKDWDRRKIKRAGQSVARGKKYPDGKTKIGRVRGVDVGMIRTHGRIATIFPLSKQRIRKRR